MASGGGFYEGWNLLCTWIFLVCSKTDDVLVNQFAYFPFSVVHQTVFAMFTHTLTSQFIWCILLIPSWPSLSPQNCINSSWHRFWSMLTCQHHAVAADLPGTSMLSPLHSQSPQSTRPKGALLRSGDCGGRWSAANSLSYSRNQSEMIRAL